MLNVKSTPLFIKEDGRVLQLLAIECVDPQSDEEFQLQIDGAIISRKIRDLRVFARNYFLEIEPLKTFKEAKCCFKGKPKSEVYLRLEPQKQATLLLVHTSHQDFGWFDLPSRIRKIYLSYHDQALDYYEQTLNYPDEAKFRWSIETAQAASEYLSSRPEHDIRRLGRAVKDGAIDVGMLYGFIIPEIASIEGLWRLTKTGGEIRRRLGHQFKSAFLNDVPGVGMGFSQYLGQAGIEYLTWGANCYRGPHYTDTEFPFLFDMESKSGDRVRVWRHSVTDTLCYLAGLPLMERSFEECVSAILPRIRPVLSGSPFDCVIFPVSADACPPYRELSDLVVWWNEQFAFPRMKICTLTQAHEEMDRQYGDSVPVLSEALVSSWTDGFGAQASLTADDRRNQTDLPEAEKLAAVARLCVGGADFEEMLDQSFDGMVYYSEHTHGWDMHYDTETLPGRMHYDELANESVRLPAAQASRIGGISLSMLSREVTVPDGAGFVVWNMSGQPRTDVVVARVLINHFRAYATWDVQDLETGCRTPAQLEAEWPEVSGYVQLGHRHFMNLEFLAKNVPSFGYRVYRLVPREVAVENCGTFSESVPGEWFSGVLDSSIYRVEFDTATGAIKSIFDKEVGRELIDVSAPHRFGQFVHFINSSALPKPEWYGLLHRFTVPVSKNTPTCRSIAKDHIGPVSVSAVMSASTPGIAEVRQKIKIYAATKTIEIDVEIHKDLIRELESGFLSFPFNLPGADYNIDMAGGSLNPALDLHKESFKDHFAQQNGVDVHSASADQGVIWSSIDAPLLQIGSLESNRWSSHWEAGDGAVNSYLFNNFFQTGNFPLTQQGLHRFRYRIFPYSGPRSISRAARVGWEHRHPMQVQFIPSAQSGVFAQAAGRLLDLELPEGVHVTAFQFTKKSGYVLRLANRLAEAAQVKVSFLGRKIRQLHRIAPSGESFEENGSDSREVILNLAPHAIRAFGFKLDEA